MDRDTGIRSSSKIITHGLDPCERGRSRGPPGYLFWLDQFSGMRSLYDQNLKLAPSRMVWVRMSARWVKTLVGYGMGGINATKLVLVTLACPKSV
jgi:hypothetical protein